MQAHPNRLDSLVSTLPSPAHPITGHHLQATGACQVAGSLAEKLGGQQQHGNEGTLSKGQTQCNINFALTGEANCATDRGSVPLGFYS